MDLQQNRWGGIVGVQEAERPMVAAKDRTRQPGAVGTRGLWRPQARADPDSDFPDSLLGGRIQFSPGGLRTMETWHIVGA